jgi:hypothetical protein
MRLPSSLCPVIGWLSASWHRRRISVSLLFLLLLFWFRTFPGARVLPAASQRTTHVDRLYERLVKTGERLIKHARYYCRLLAEGHLRRRLLARCCGGYGRCRRQRVSAPVAVTKSGAEGGRSAQCLEKPITRQQPGVSDGGKKRTVGTTSLDGDCSSHKFIASGVEGALGCAS